MAVFNFTFQPSMSVEQMLAFQMAGEIWSQYLQDDITVNVQVGTTHSLPDEVIGGAIPTYVEVDIASLKAALAHDITSDNDATAVANLGQGDTVSALLNGTTYTSDTVTLTQAQAEALGLAEAHSETSDGYIVVNALGRPDGPSWSTDLERSSSPDPQKLDLLSVALHEVGHILGFISGVDAEAQGGIEQQLAKTSLLDLFRYSDASLQRNSQELTRGAAAYFSLDGGTTEIAAFATGIVPVGNSIDGYQASHWGSGQAAQSRLSITEEQFSADPMGSFIRAIFALSKAATDQDWVDSSDRLLVKPSTSRVLQLIGQTAEPPTEQPTEQLGIMDPSLAAGNRSSISALDLVAFDAIGYDIANTGLDLDYAKLLASAEASLAQQFNLNVDELHGALKAENREKFGGRMADILKAMERGQAFERRRSRRKRKDQSFWQEQKLRPKKRGRKSGEAAAFNQDQNRLEITSDGGGTEASLSVEAGSQWVTQVQATPRSPFTLRIQNLQGSDADDLILPIYDLQQSINTGGGNNIVQLGLQGGKVSSGKGNDTLLFKGGNSNVLDLGGDNLIWAKGDAKAVHHIKTGTGNDQVHFSGKAFTINTGAGDDVVIGEGLNNIRKASKQKIDVGDGNNTVFVRSSGSQSTEIHAGQGDQTLEAHGFAQIIRAGDGNHRIKTNSSRSSITVGDGVHEIWGNSRSTTLVTGDGNQSIWMNGSAYADHHITTGNGNNQIRFYGVTASVNTGAGHDLVLGKSNPHLKPRFYAPADYRVDVGDGNNIVVLDGSPHHQISVTAGSGDDVIRADGKQVDLTTGSGKDTIILGDAEGTYFQSNSSYATIRDFDHQDTLKLYGGQDNYSIRGNELLYGNNKIAEFSEGIKFSLDGPQVDYFHSSNAPSLGLSKSQRQFRQETIRRRDSSLDVARTKFAELKLAEPEALLKQALEKYQAPTPVTYRISGGADGDRFVIDPSSGELRLKQATTLNSDADGDSIFEVVVMATQGNGNFAQESDQQTLRIRLEDLDHTGTIGTDGNDTLKGSRRNDVIQGRAGDDIITANAGNDTISGGAGNDALIGGLGDDIINGSNSVRRGQGEIDHYLEGGAGADMFVLGDRQGSYYATSGDGDYAFIADYTAGIDQTVVFGSVSNYTTETIEGGTWLLFNNDPIAVFDGVTNLDLSQMQFV